MGYIILNKVDFSTSLTKNQEVTIKHRLSTDPDVESSYVIDTISAVVDTEGYFQPEFVIKNLLDNQEYVVQIYVTECVGTPFSVTYDTLIPTTTTTTTSTTTTTTATPTTTTTTSSTTTSTSTTTTSSTTTTTTEALIWVENTSVCEQESVFSLNTEITGFSSPAVLYYDTTTQRMYVGDNDETSGNVYWFNPSTIDDPTDVTFIPGFASSSYNMRVDEQYERIYFVGKNTGGLVSYSVTNNNFTTVTYGTDGVDYNRITLDIAGDNIIVFDKTAGNEAVIKINRTTLIKTTIPVSGIPSGATYFSDEFNTIKVGSTYWVAAQYRANGDIAIYNEDFTTLIETITIPNKELEIGSKYRQGIYYDEANGKVYFSDFGSSRLYVIDTTTKNILLNRQYINREGKLYSQQYIVSDPITNDFYLNISCYDHPATDTNRKNRVFKINKTDYSLEVLYANQAFGQLVHQIGTNNVWGSYAGTTEWGGVAGWDTDGKILKFTR